MSYFLELINYHFSELLNILSKNTIIIIISQKMVDKYNMVYFGIKLIFFIFYLNLQIIKFFKNI